MFAKKHHPLLVLNFLLQSLAEHALAIFVVMVQGLLEALPDLMRDHWRRNNCECGCSRLAPASLP